MGVDICMYRSRIGCFNACARSPRSRQCISCYNPESKWDVWTELTVGMLIRTAAVYAMVGSAFCLQIALTSNCIQSLQSAMLGYDVQCVPISNVKVSNSVGYIFDGAHILLLGGDIELNPGPVEISDMQRMLKEMREELETSLTKKFSDMLACEMQKVRDNFNGLSEKLDQVERSVSDIGEKLDGQMEQMGRIEDRQDGLECLLEGLSDRVEQQEIRSRRDNILLYGVAEEDGRSESYEDSVQKVLQTVNDVLTAPLQQADIVRAHRIGKRAAGKTRPLIACMARSSDKLAILQKRAELRSKNIGVSCDLTMKQREELNQARQEGFFAYFKGGVLHKEARRQAPDIPRPLTRSFAKALNGTAS